VVHVPEHSDVQVTKVARNEIGDDLPSPVPQRFVTSGPALGDDMDVVRPLAL